LDWGAVSGSPWYRLLLDLEQAAAAESLPRFGTALRVDDKGGFDLDPVTEADRTTEAALRQLLHERVPDHGVLGEEFAATPTSGSYTWVLDPIDGTRAFIAGFPTWVTLIALVERGVPVVGSISAPATATSWRGGVGPNGRWAERQTPSGTFPIRVRPCADLAGAIASTTSPELFHGPAADVWATLCAQTRLRRYGGDGYAYGNLASGLVDLVMENQLQPYDIAAVVAVVRGAGGVATAWDGGDPLGGSGTLLACGDERLHAQVLALIQAYGA
jgi:myo-inositol-1(or 4)-monophosphatase